MADRNYTKTYTMYGTGGAIDFRPDNGGMFVKAAPMLPNAAQMTGPVPAGTKRFDWQNSVTMYFSQAEILKLIGLGEIMLRRMPIHEKTGSFYHERDNVATRLDINAIVNNGRITGYILTLKRKEQTDNNFRIVASHQLRLEDIVFFSKILPQLIFTMLEWDTLKNQTTQDDVSVLDSPQNTLTVSPNTNVNPDKPHYGNRPYRKQTPDISDTTTYPEINENFDW